MQSHRNCRAIEVGTVDWVDLDGTYILQFSNNLCFFGGGRMYHTSTNALKCTTKSYVGEIIHLLVYARYLMRDLSQRYLSSSYGFYMNSSRFLHDTPPLARIAGRRRLLYIRGMCRHLHFGVLSILTRPLKDVLRCHFLVFEKQKPSRRSGRIAGTSKLQLIIISSAPIIHTWKGRLFLSVTPRARKINSASGALRPMRPTLFNM